MNKELLLLKLEGPFQSWGSRSRWDIRDTHEAPTKSGIVGLLGCALGIKRSDTTLQSLSRAIVIGVRIDRPGVSMTDFHTIRGILPTADGKAKGKEEDPSTIVSRREYLNDAVFLVAIESETQMLNRLADALQNPRWILYLGRKSCVPSRPIFEKMTNQYDSITSALEIYPWETLKEDEKPPKRLKCLVESEDGNLLRQDEVIVNPGRMYSYRKEYICYVECPQE